jgi:hypothetical protein
MLYLKIHEFSRKCPVDIWLQVLASSRLIVSSLSMKGVEEKLEIRCGCKKLGAFGAKADEVTRKRWVNGGWKRRARLGARRRVGGFE